MFVSFGSSNTKKNQGLGIVFSISTSNIIKKFTKALICLSFVKLSRLEYTFYSLLEHDEFPVLLRDVYEYFSTTYMNLNGNALYPPNIWHSFNYLNREVPRTNNAIEGWHNCFNNTFGTSKYSFPLLIEKLKNEEDYVRIRMIQSLQLGYNFERKKKYIEKENQLFVF